MDYQSYLIAVDAFLREATADSSPPTYKETLFNNDDDSVFLIIQPRISFDPKPGIYSWDGNLSSSSKSFSASSFIDLRTALITEWRTFFEHSHYKKYCE